MSDAKLISSGSPFEKTYGYSRAVVSGDEVHIAGTTGYDYATMAMPDDVAEQTRNIYATFADVMKEAGGDLADIVRLRTFVTDAAYCEAVLKVQGEVFGAIRPAATIVVVSALLRAGNEGRDRGRRAARRAEVIARALSGGFLHPQRAPAGRRDVAVDELARIGGDELNAAVALVAVLRRGLILDRGLRQFRLRLAAREREQRRRARGGDQDGAAADARFLVSLTHERLLRRRDHLARRGSPPPANRSACLE